MSESYFCIVTYIEGCETLPPDAADRVVRLVEGQPLLVSREGPSTVRLLDLYAQPLGYVGEDEVAAVAARMDAGDLLLARVETPVKVLARTLFGYLVTYPTARIWSEGRVGVDEHTRVITKTPARRERVEERV